MTALQEQLDRLADRGPYEDPLLVIRRASAVAFHDIDPEHDVSFVGTLHVRDDPPGDMRTRRRWLGVAAASVIAVTGGLGFVALRPDDAAVGSTTVASVAVTEPPVTSAAVVDTTSGPLLSTPVPSEVRPMLTVGQPGWTVDGWSGFTIMQPTAASASCAGCGVTRLVVAADGPMFSGAIFTAWAIDDDYEISEFDWPIDIGATAGRFIGSADGSTAAAENQVRVVWPLGPGRTAFVEAVGLANEQVFAMAASVNFDGGVPTMTSPPPGFSVRPTPPAEGASEQFYMSLTNGRSVLEVIATNHGLQGLLDWQSLAGSPMRWSWTPRSIGGTTIAFDPPDAPDERPIVSVSSTWVAGGWGYTVIGHIFDSEAEFLDTVAQLQLTDSATFAAATANVAATTMGYIAPSLDGTSGTVMTPP